MKKQKEIRIVTILKNSKLLSWLTKNKHRKKNVTGFPSENVKTT